MSDTGSVRPFVFERPLENAGDLLDRDDQLAVVAGALERRSDAVVEGAPRHGKTSLVNVSLAEFASRDGTLAVHVDCGGVLTVDDLVRRLEDAYATAGAHGSSEHALIERLEALAFAPSVVDLQDPGTRVGLLFDVAADVARTTDGHAVVALDEVNDVLGVAAMVDGISGARERAADVVSYVFVGPELSTSAGELWSADTPVVEVGALDPELFTVEVTRRFADAGRDAGEAAHAIATVGGGHPQRSSLLAAELWQLTAEGERATIATARAAIDSALIRSAPEFDARWNSLYANERRVAVALANGIAPQGTRAQRATGLAGAGAAQRALQGVKSSGVARTDGEQTVLTDPLFAEWLRRRYPQAPREPGWQALRRRAEMQRGGISRGM